jgi:hypothetical protein
VLAQEVLCSVSLGFLRVESHPRKTPYPHLPCRLTRLGRIPRMQQGAGQSCASRQLCGLSSILRPLSNARLLFAGVYSSMAKFYVSVKRQNLILRMDCPSGLRLSPSNGHPGHEHENTTPSRAKSLHSRTLSRAKAERSVTLVLQEPPRLENASQPGNVVRMGSPSSTARLTHLDQRERSTCMWPQKHNNKLVCQDCALHTP